MTLHDRPFSPVCNLLFLQGYSYDKQVIDGVCGSRAVESSPCEGPWLNRDRFIDWLRCKTCNGTGYHQIKRCPDCKNSGWVLVR